jgi:hypothetical protein
VSLAILSSVKETRDRWRCNRFEGICGDWSCEQLAAPPLLADADDLGESDTKEHSRCDCDSYDCTRWRTALRDLHCVGFTKQLFLSRATDPLMVHSIKSKAHLENVTL